MFKKGNSIQILYMLVFLGGLLAASYLLSQKTSFFSRAGSSDAPHRIKISNLADNSFTVSWVTDEAALGFISYGTTASLGMTATDDRSGGGTKSGFTHHITLKKLTPNTVYYYKIGSGTQIYDDKGRPYTQTTAPTTLGTPPLPDPLFGKVQRGDKSSPEEALIYIQTEGGTLLSGYVREAGNWLVTLNNARTKDLFDYYQIKNNEQLKAEVEAGEDGTIKATLLAKDRSAGYTILLGKEAAVSPTKEPVASEQPTTSNQSPFRFLDIFKGLLDR